MCYVACDCKNCNTEASDLFVSSLLMEPEKRQANVTFMFCQKRITGYALDYSVDRNGYTALPALGLYSIRVYNING